MSSPAPLDEEWFSKICHNHAMWLKEQISVRYLLSWDDAEDVTQEVLKTLTYMDDRPAEPDQQRALLYGIMKNVVFRHWRGQAKDARLTGKAIAERAAAGEAYDQIGQWIEGFTHQELLADALTPLSEDERTMLFHAYVLGDTSEQIGLIMGLREGTVRTRLHRAKKKAQDNANAAQRMRDRELKKARP